MRFLQFFLSIIICFPVFGQYSDSIPLNDIRVLASHNSYKLKPDPRVSKFLQKHKKKLGKENDPKQLEYGHLPLTIQLDSFNIRGFALDAYYDPEGGRYRKRKINVLVKGMKKKSENRLLELPGFKLIHISDVDYETNYTLLVEALDELREWSLTHEGHIPLFVNIEAKGSGLGDESKILSFLGFKKALPYDSLAYLHLDNEIKSIFNEDEIYTTKDLQGDFSSVKERLDSIGWPKFEEVKGQIIFILEGSNSAFYRTSLNAGENRPMFSYGRPGDPATAFIVNNQPIGHEEKIDSLANIYMVRTRSDAGTLEARANDYSRWNAALKSNAQIISTDYYKPDTEISHFFVKFPVSFPLRTTIKK
jgi:hypothetical protein